MNVQNLSHVATSSNSENVENESKIIPFLKRRDNSTGQSTSNSNYISVRRFNPAELRRDFSDNTSFDSIRKKIDNELIDFAYAAIIDSRDQSNQKVERSNFFDEWKDTLDSILTGVKNFSSNHRKILGALIVAVKQKDISDFDNDGLRLMENATYMLRQFRLTKNDSKKIINDLLKLKISIIIPLACDNLDPKTEEELDIYMKSVIEKSN